MQSVSVLISYILFYDFDKTNFQERIPQAYWFVQNCSKDEGQVLYVYEHIYELIYWYTSFH